MDNMNSQININMPRSLSTVSPHKLPRRYILGMAFGLSLSMAITQHSAGATPVPKMTGDVSLAETEPLAQSGYRTVKLDMNLISFSKKVVQVKAGELIRFVLRNTSDIPHEFTIGTSIVQEGRRAVLNDMTQSETLVFEPTADQSYDGPNAIIVLPGEERVLLWRFTDTQGLEFGCNLPGHYEMGMQGNFEITAAQSVMTSGETDPTSTISEAAPEPETKPEPVAEAEPEPETTPEPMAEAKPVLETEPKPMAEAEPVPETKPEPMAEAEPVPETEPEPMAEAEPVPETKPDPIAEAEPVPETKPEPMAEAESVPETEPGPITEAEPVPETKPEPMAEAESVPETQSESETETKPEAMAESEPVEPVKTVEPPSAVVAVSQSPSSPPKAAHRTTPQFSYGVLQLSSQRNMKAARKSWRRMARRHAGILAGKQHFIARADLGRNGIFYRLRVGGFTSRAELRRACAAIRRRGDACICVPPGR